MAAALELISQHRCFGGSQRYYRHDSAEIGLPMRFSVFVPPQAEQGPVPVLFYLAGLTRTEETFMIKAGAQRRRRTGRDAGGAGHQSARRQRAGRGRKLGPGHWRGLLSDATMPAWSRHYRMDSYVTRELHAIATGGELPGDAGRAGICGHSMGGHGALVLALRNPGKYCSVPSRRSPRPAAALGQEGVRRLSGRRRPGLGRL